MLLPPIFCAEVPLKVTPFGKYTDDETGRRIVWPEQNDVDVSIEDLTNAKLKRNNEYYSNGKSFSEPFSVVLANGKKITIKGNPTFAEIRTMTIGAKIVSNDENLCFEMWVNEFRMTDFEDKSGWAALARVSAKLADLGTVTVSGSHKTAGFGSIESKVSQRSQENTTQYDVFVSLN